MITNPVFIVVVLIAIEALVLGLSRHGRTKRFFDLLPAVFWIYFLPMLAATFGLITSKSPVYGMITTWLLPASLVLLLLPVDMRAILRLGPKALAMFFIGAAGIIAGSTISFALFQPSIGSEFWTGFGALSASWTGGSANMIAVKEALAVPDTVFAPMVIVDTVVPYLWMGMLIAAVGLQPAFDRWNRSERAVLDNLGEHVIQHLTKRGNRRTVAGVALSLAIAFAGSGLAHMIAKHLPQINDVVSSYTWTITVVHPGP